MGILFSSSDRAAQKATAQETKDKTNEMDRLDKEAQRLRKEGDNEGSQKAWRAFKDLHNDQWGSGRGSAS